MDKASDTQLAIIGSGISGLTSAFFILKKYPNLKISIFEAEDEVSQKASFANGGQISVGGALSWHSLNNIRKAIKWNLKNEITPFKLNGFFSKVNAEKRKFLTSFALKTLTPFFYRKTSTKAVKFGIESEVILSKFLARLEHDQDDAIKNSLVASDKGMLSLFFNKKEFKRAKKDSEKIFLKAGYKIDFLNSQQIYEFEPRLKSIKATYLSAILSHKDFSLDVHSCSLTLKKILQNSGVNFYFNKQLESLEFKNNSWDLSFSDLSKPSEVAERLSNMSFDRVLIAAGVNSYQLLDKVRPVNLNFKKFLTADRVYPIKGHSITLELDVEQAKIVARRPITDTEARIVYSYLMPDSYNLKPRIRIAGLAHLEGYDTEVKIDAVEHLISWLRKTFPQLKFSNKEVQSFACLRPMMPDMTPQAILVAQGLFLNTGGGNLGWTHAFALGRKISDIFI